MTLYAATMVAPDKRVSVPDLPTYYRRPGLKLKALVGFRGDGERAHVTSASIKEPSKAFPRLRVL